MLAKGRIGTHQLAPHELREGRDRAGLSRRELAGEVGCSEGLIRHWETGRRRIEPRWAAKLERALVTRAPAKQSRMSGRQLRALRTDHGLTPRGLGRLLGVTRQAVQGWEASDVPSDRAAVVLRLAALARQGRPVDAAALRARREHAGVTQLELARCLTVTQRQVSDLELGKAPVPVSLWPRVDDALDSLPSERPRPEEPVTGDELKLGRARLRWSQARLAVELCVATSVVGNWEAGARKRVPPKHWRRLRELFATRDPEHASERDRVVDDTRALVLALAQQPALRGELYARVDLPEPRARAALRAGLAEGLVHERAMPRRRSDGVVRLLTAIYPGREPADRTAPDLANEHVPEVVELVRRLPGLTPRQLTDSLPHGRARGMDAIALAVAAGQIHERRLASGSGVARVGVRMFAGPHIPSLPLAGEQLRAMRKAANVGQAELAAALATTAPLLRRWERSRVPDDWCAPVRATLAECSRRARSERREQILVTVNTQPGRLSRWALPRYLAPAHRRGYAAEIEELIALGELHERLTEDERGAVLAPGPPPAGENRAPIPAHELRSMVAESGLSQSELGARLGAGVATVNGWVRGESVPEYRRAQLRRLLGEALAQRRESARPSEPPLPGHELRRRRGRRSQLALARQVNVSQPVLSRWERSRSGVPAQYRAAVRAALGRPAPAPPRPWASKLARARGAAGLTVKQLADRIDGASHSSLYAWESGRAEPPQHRRAAVEDALASTWPG